MPVFQTENEITNFFTFLFFSCFSWLSCSFLSQINCKPRLSLINDILTKWTDGGFQLIIPHTTLHFLCIYFFIFYFIYNRQLKYYLRFACVISILFNMHSYSFIHWYFILFYFIELFFVVAIFTIDFTSLQSFVIVMLKTFRYCLIDC